MWALQLLPDWTIHLALVAGVVGIIAGFLFQFVPFVAQYKLPIQIISIIVVVATVYLEGGMSERSAWEARVLEMEAKVAQAEVESAKANANIATQVITKIQYVKDTTNANKQAINIYGQSLNDSCRLTNGAVMLHNSASQNEVPGSPTATAGAASDVKASQLLTTVVENYGTYYELREKLLAWQLWYKQQKEIFESVN